MYAIVSTVNVEDPEVARTLLATEREPLALIIHAAA